jgi:hypothetical protein
MSEGYRAKTGPRALQRTVKRYLETGGWHPYKKVQAPEALEGLEDWLRERLRQHRGNAADVVRQEPLSEMGIVASRRTVQRALEPYRQELRAEALQGSFSSRSAGRMAAGKLFSSLLAEVIPLRSLHW